VKDPLGSGNKGPVEFAWKTSLGNGAVLTIVLSVGTSFAQAPEQQAGQAQADQTETEEAQADPTDTVQAEADQTETQQAEAVQTEADQAETQQAEPSQARTDPADRAAAGTPSEETTPAFESEPTSPERNINTSDQSSSTEARVPKKWEATNGSPRHFSLTPGGYVQTRLEHDNFAYSVASQEVDPYAPDVPSRSATHLTLRRAVVFVDGSVYVPELTFRIQLGFDPNFSLEDAYANYAFTDSFQLRVGRDKRPFSRQYLNRRRFLQWADLARAERYFGPSRDVGVLIHNDYLRTTGFEYALGVYQGQFDYFSYDQPLDDDPRATLIQSDETDAHIEPTVVFRVGYNNGPGTYSESAWGGGDFVYGVALSGLLDLNSNQSGSSRAQVELDGIFKVGGFSISYMLSAELRQTGNDFVKSRDQGGAATSLQAGYVIKQRVEPVIRLSAALMGTGVDASSEPFSETEAAAGLNVYFFGHDLKWTNEVSRASVREQRGQPEDFQIRHTQARSQLQFGF
jgi:hypothetical protein